jgi:hypothetical protein
MSQKLPLSSLGSKYQRHPDNHNGQGSPEFWDAEYKLWGVSRSQYHEIKKEQTPKCPTCGIPYGYAWGTGDCGCGDDY